MTTLVNDDDINVDNYDDDNNVDKYKFKFDWRKTIKSWTVTLLWNNGHDGVDDQDCWW